MITVETLPDGTIVTKFSPKRGVPQFRDWLAYLLSVGAAYKVTEKVIDHDTKLPKVPTEWRDTIKATDRHMEQASQVAEDGTVKIVCIGCGVATSKLDMSRIRIGGLIQLPHEERVSESEIEVTYRRRPVSKGGLGCPECTAKYTEAQATAVRDAENKGTDGAYGTLRDELADARLTIAFHQRLAVAPAIPEKCKHGMDSRFCAACLRLPTAGTVKHRPSERSARDTAYVDIFD